MYSLIVCNILWLFHHLLFKPDITIILIAMETCGTHTVRVPTWHRSPLISSSDWRGYVKYEIFKEYM